MTPAKLKYAFYFLLFANLTFLQAQTAGVNMEHHQIVKEVHKMAMSFTNQSTEAYTGEVLYPFFNLGNGEIGTTDVVAKLKHRSELGIGMYLKHINLKAPDHVSISADVEISSIVPKRSNFQPGEKILLQPIDYTILDVETLGVANTAPDSMDYEIGLYIDVGVALRIEGLGLGSTLVNYPGGYLNSGNQQEIRIPLLQVVNNELQIIPDNPLPPLISEKLNNALQDSKYYKLNSDPDSIEKFKISIPHLGLELKHSYQKNIAIRIPSLIQVIEDGKKIKYSVFTGNQIDFEFNFTRFVKNLVEPFLSKCRTAPICRYVKAASNIIFPYRKDFIVGVLEHEGLRVSLVDKYKPDIFGTLTPKIAALHYNIGERVPFAIYNNDDENLESPLPYISHPNISDCSYIDTCSEFIVPFGKKAVFDYPTTFFSDNPKDVYMKAALNIWERIPSEASFQANYKVYRVTGFEYSLLTGSFKPAEKAKSVLSKVKIDFLVPGPVRFGPIYAGFSPTSETLENVTTLNIDKNESHFYVRDDTNNQENPGILATGSLDAINTFTEDIVKKVYERGTVLDVASIYPGYSPSESDPFIFSPETIIEDNGDYTTINVTYPTDPSFNHSFRVKYLDLSAPYLNPDISDAQEQLDELLGTNANLTNGFFFNSDELTPSTDGSCTFQVPYIETLKNNVRALFKDSKTPTNDLIVEIENKLKLGSNTISVYIKTPDASEGARYKFAGIYNAFVFDTNNYAPIPFTLESDTIEIMIQDDGFARLGFGDSEIYDDDGNLLRTESGIKYTMEEPDDDVCVLTDYSRKMSLSKTKFTCNDLGSNTVTITSDRRWRLLVQSTDSDSDTNPINYTTGSSKYTKDITVNVILNPDLEFTNNAMYINSSATGKNNGTTMEDGFNDVASALNLLACRLESVETVYIKNGDYVSYSSSTDPFELSAEFNSYLTNTLNINKDMTFESVDGISQIFAANFVINTGVKATFRNINFVNTTIIAGKNTDVTFENCAFNENQLAIISSGKVEAYNCTFVRSSGGPIVYKTTDDGDNSNDNQVFTFIDEDNFCFPNPEDRDHLNDVATLMFYGNQNTETGEDYVSKFVNCTFHHNIGTYLAAPLGVFCKTKVEFNNCIIDNIGESQTEEGLGPFLTGTDTTLDLNNCFLDLNSNSISRATTCDQPNINCDDRTQFFEDVNQDHDNSWFPGANNFSFETIIGEAAPDEDYYSYNLRLKDNSIAIDQGNNALYNPPPTVTTDLGGESRISGAAIDVGAFEFQGATLDSNDKLNKDNVNVYPIPFKEEVTIKLKNNQKAKYVLFDLIGNKIRDGKLELNKNQVNLSGLSSGIYLLKIYSGHSNYSQKIIKE